MKDTNAQKCYPLTTKSLYPIETGFEDTYQPKDLTLIYESETSCPYAADPDVNFSMTFIYECIEDD